MRVHICKLCAFVCAITFAAAARGDEAADKLLAQVEKKTKEVGTLVADISTTWAPLPGNKELALVKPGVSLARRWTGKVHFRRPNFTRFENTMVESGNKTTMISDGLNLWQWDTASDKCYKYLAEPNNADIEVSDAWPSFFNPDFAGMIADADATTRYLGLETVDGIEYRVVEMIGLTADVRWYIGQDDLVHRMREDAKITGADQRLVISLSNFVVNGTVPDASFRFDPPAGKEVVAARTGLESLLPVGADAPEFELPLATGEKISLAEIRKGKRLTIVNYWNFSCGPCLVELPHLQMLYENVRSQGVEVVAVHLVHAPAVDLETQSRLNALKSRDAFESYTLSRIAEYSREKSISFRILADTSGKVGESYKIEGFPTTYFLDENGKIVHRMLGYSTSRMRAALKTLGIDETQQ